MRITSKGQVTIPLAIRKKAGLLPNTEVTFTMSRGLIVLRKAANGRSRGRRLIEQMRGKATTRLTTDEILAMTRRA
jgi:AbrB family looped-hinge helix DNA binding protein